MAVKDDKYVTLPTGQSAGIEKELHLSRDIVAPVEQGQELGVMKVMLESKVLAELPIIATKPVERGGFFSRTTDKFKRLVN